MEKKTSKRFSMKDLHAEHKDIDGVKEVAEKANENEIELIYNESFEEKTKAYNEVVSNLDVRYKSLVPFHKILVRMYMKSVRDENGMIIPDKVPVRSRQGHVIGEIDNPYPYSKKAVVVAKPEHIKNINIGDTLLLRQSPVIGQELTGDDAFIAVAGGFIHPDHVEKYHRFPTDPEDENYGYVLVDYHEIEMSIN